MVVEQHRPGRRCAATTDHADEYAGCLLETGCVACRGVAVSGARKLKRASVGRSIDHSISVAKQPRHLATGCDVRQLGECERPNGERIPEVAEHAPTLADSVCAHDCACAAFARLTMEVGDSRCCTVCLCEASDMRWIRNTRIFRRQTHHVQTTSLRQGARLARFGVRSKIDDKRNAGVGKLCVTVRRPAPARATVPVFDLRHVLGELKRYRGARATGSAT